MLDLIIKGSKNFKKIAIFLSVIIFFFTANTSLVYSDDVTVTAVVPGENQNQNTNQNQNNNGGGSGYASSSSIITINFSGKAYPNSAVTILNDGFIAVTTIAGGDANFQVSLSQLTAGSHNFIIYSEDYQGQQSNLISIPITLTNGVVVTIGGIFIPPSIEVDKAEVKKGGDITIMGQTTPNSNLTIVVNSETEYYLTTTSNSSGLYSASFDTSPLNFGQHHTKTKASTSTLVSSFSKLAAFQVGNMDIPKITSPALGDINGDGQVNLVDFSIAVFWYNKPSPPAEIDLNSDGKVDLIDFSIMAYHWTG